MHSEDILDDIYCSTCGRRTYLVAYPSWWVCFSCMLKFKVVDEEIKRTWILKRNDDCQWCTYYDGRWWLVGEKYNKSIEEEYANYVFDVELMDGGDS